VWRTMDPMRTGILPAGPVAEDEYLDFALGAPAMLLDPVDGRYLPFGHHWANGEVTLENWHDHLSTLFPDVRPRGYLEVRCLDAIPSDWYPAPIALLTGLLYHRPSLLTANDLLGSPNPALLDQAASAAMSDPSLGLVARDLFIIGLEGARGLGADFIAEPEVERAEEFARCFTFQGRSPADFTSSLQ
jgi:glutamate--cysteine ligase